MDKVRFGVIGAGNMGSGHVNMFWNNEVEGAELAAVCDINPEKLDVVREKCGDKIAYYTDYNELINSGKVDAITIATPHYLHPVIGIAAFEAGLHVISEKPIGVYTKKVREFMEAAKKSGKVFGIMYNQRTDKYYQKMREMVQNGEIGEMTRCTWIITNWYRPQAYYNSSDWRATWAGEGGGVLMNQCPHNLDLWQWIAGVPKKIRAFCSFGKYHDIEVEDDVTAYAEYENGATGMFVATTGECPGTNRLEIAGTRGKLVYEHGKLLFTKNDRDSREYSNDLSVAPFSGPHNETTEITVEGQGRGHVEIFTNFTQSILTGEKLLAPGYEGINGLSIANAMLLSSWKNDIVDVQNDGEEYWQYLSEKIKTSRKKSASGSGKVVDLSGTYGENK